MTQAARRRAPYADLHAVRRRLHRYALRGLQSKRAGSPSVPDLIQKPRWHSSSAVGRTMVLEALKSSNPMGLTVTRTGKGTFVIANKVAHDLKLGKYSGLELM